MSEQLYLRATDGKSSADVSLDQTGCRVTFNDCRADVKVREGEFGYVFTFAGRTRPTTLFTEPETDEAPMGILLASRFKCVSYGTSADSSVEGLVSTQLPSALARDIHRYSHRWTGLKADTKFSIESITLEPGSVHGIAGTSPRVYETYGCTVVARRVEDQLKDLHQALLKLSNSQAKVPVKLTLRSKDPLVPLKPMYGSLQGREDEPAPFN